MFTKKDFCMCIIDEFRMENHIDPEIKDGELESYILLSSRLAVALEYLGLIGELSIRRYAATRGGIEYTYIDGELAKKIRKDPSSNKGEDFVKTLTTRELLDLLPEDK